MPPHDSDNIQAQQPDEAAQPAANAQTPRPHSVNEARQAKRAQDAAQLAANREEIARHRSAAEVLQTQRAQDAAQLAANREEIARHRSAAEVLQTQRAQDAAQRAGAVTKRDNDRAATIRGTDSVATGNRGSEARNHDSEQEDNA